MIVPSDTPLTDIEEEIDGFVSSEFARGLERRLNDMKQYEYDSTMLLHKVQDELDSLKKHMQCWEFR